MTRQTTACQLCGQALISWPCPASWDSEHRPSNRTIEEPTPDPIWTARIWVHALAHAEQNGDAGAAQILTTHGIYAHHCGGYDVHAWPCPAAAATLNHLYGVTP